MSALPRDTTLRVAVFTAIICSIAAAIYTVAELEPALIRNRSMFRMALRGSPSVRQSGTGAGLGAD